MFLLQMSGAPGSGKSTLAKEILGHINSIILDHDVIKSSLIESGIDFNLAGKASYNVIWSLADYYLSLKHNIIIDSPCFYVEGLEKGIFLAKKYEFQYKYIECRIDNLEEIDHRLRKRKKMISQVSQVISDRTDEKVFQNWIENMKRPSDIPYIVVDTSKPLTSYMKKVIDYIENEVAF